MPSYRCFPSTNGPASAVNDSNAYSFGIEFEVTSDCTFDGWYWWCQKAGSFNLRLYEVVSATTGTQLHSKTGVTFSTLGAWNFSGATTTVNLTTGKRYRAVVYSATTSFYCFTDGYWTTDRTTGPLHVFSGAQATGADQNQIGTNVDGYPTDSFNNGNFWVDLQVSTAAPPLTASAGADAKSNTGKTTTRTGTDSGSVTSRSWTQLSGPTVTLSGASTATVSFTGPGATGAIVLRYSVSDGTTTVTDDVTFTNLVGKTVAIVGDSLFERVDSTDSGSRESTTRGRLVTAGWAADNIAWYARGGKQITAADSNGRSTIDDLDGFVAAVGAIDQLVVALCTNDAFVGVTDSAFNTSVQAVLDKIALLGIPDTLWVDCTFYDPADTRSAHYNALLVAKLAGVTGVRYLGWDAYMHGPRVAGDWIFPTDDIHYTTQGYTKRDDWTITNLLATGGTLAGQIPKVTGTITGTTVTSGTVAGALPKITGVVTGTSITTGTVAGTLPPVTGAVSGTSLTVGTLAGTLRPVTGLVTGASITPIAGTIAGTLPRIISTSFPPPPAPPERTGRVLAELRTHVVPVESRAVTAAAESRTTTV